MSGHLGCKTKKTKLILEFNSKGFTVQQIVDKIKDAYPKTNYDSVMLRLSRNKIKANREKRERTGSVTDSYFEKINTHRTAYFFGLICADGSVNVRESRVSISLKKEDAYLIHELKKELNCTYKISVRHPPNGGAQEVIQMYSDKMVSDLISHGCTERKSLTLKFPKLERKFIGSFLRGYFDGDGWLHEFKSGDKTYKKFGIIGSNKFCDSANMFLKLYFNIDSRVYVYKNGKYSVLYIGKQTEVFKIREVLYEFDSISLARKKDKFYSKYIVVYQDTNREHFSW